jgi:hypothetical protein
MHNAQEKSMDIHIHINMKRECSPLSKGIIQDNRSYLSLCRILLSLRGGTKRRKEGGRMDKIV